jgi:hypothetical protein
MAASPMTNLNQKASVKASRRPAIARTRLIRKINSATSKANATPQYIIVGFNRMKRDVSSTSAGMKGTPKASENLNARRPMMLNATCKTNVRQSRLKKSPISLM